MPIYLDRAIDNPVPENVRAYKFLERVAMDKSSRFAEVSTRVVLGDPLLDETARRPISDFAAKAYNQKSSTETDNLLRSIAANKGIFFFYLSSCSFCEKQVPLLQNLERLYGFTVQAISIDGLPMPSGAYPNFLADNGQARMLNIQATPALFLADPATSQLEPVGQGLLSFSEIKTRIATAALRAGWISEEDLDDSRPLNNIMRTDRGLESIPNVPPVFMDLINKTGASVE